MDRLVVADRHTIAVQILTKDGRFVPEYDDFGRSSGLRSTRTTRLTADSESTERVSPWVAAGGPRASGRQGATFIPAHKGPMRLGRMAKDRSTRGTSTPPSQPPRVTKYVKQ